MNDRGIKTNIDDALNVGMSFHDKINSSELLEACGAFDCFMKYWDQPDFKSRMKQYKNYSPSVFKELVEISENWKEQYKVAENPKLKEFNNVVRRYRNKELPEYFMQYIDTMVKLELITRKFKTHKLKEKFINKKIYHSYKEYLNII